MARKKLHLRIWLVATGSVVALGSFVGVAWDFNEQAHLHQPAPYQVTVRDANGAVIDSAKTGPVQPLPDGGLDFKADLDGQGPQSQVDVQIQPRIPTGIWSTVWNWLRPPYSFWWVLTLTGVIVMAYMYPLARQLTRRLITLQQGVLRWEQGDLSIRFPESGGDEIDDLARHFNAAADRVTAQIESQKTLLAYASHELRSPLARIRMAVELASQSDTAARQRAHTEIVYDLDELDEIIGRILLATQLEIKPDLYNNEPVDLIGLLAEECARVDIPLNIAPEVAANTANCVVSGSLFLLRHAVRNLLENATQYGRRADKTHDNSVLLECENTGDHAALIHFDDCGPGVPIEQRKYIFEPFYTLPGIGKRGLGLGLALVRMIAERHGGSIRCSDHAGGGARFTLRLPRQAPSQAA